MFFSRTTALEKALDQYAKGGVEWDDTVAQAAEDGIRNPAEAKAVVRILAAVAAAPQRYPGASGAVLLLQTPGNEAIANLLREKALPHVVTLMEVPADPTNDLFSPLAMIAAKIGVMYQEPNAVMGVVKLAARGTHADHHLWEVIFGIIAEAPGLNLAVASTLGMKIPGGFCGIAFLDFCNTMAREENLSPHPFDHATGHARLRTWLNDAENPSYGHSVAATLPYLASAPLRDELLALARANPAAEIRLEAAWAAAKLGDASGLSELAAAARNPQTADLARTYLTELGASDQIPAEAQGPAGAALAEMGNWLRHPQEFGRGPDELRIVDQRTLHWPPVGEDRAMTLVYYRYLPTADSTGSEGIGCLGSVTFALFGIDDLVGKTPEAIYGLYCVWEFGFHGDARFQGVPGSVGETLLAEANPGFGGG